MLSDLNRYATNLLINPQTPIPPFLSFPQFNSLNLVLSRNVQSTNLLKSNYDNVPASNSLKRQRNGANASENLKPNAAAPIAKRLRNRDDTNVIDNTATPIADQEKITSTSTIDSNTGTDKQIQAISDNILLTDDVVTINNNNNKKKLKRISSKPNKKTEKAVYKPNPNDSLITKITSAKSRKNLQPYTAPKKGKVV